MENLGKYLKTQRELRDIDLLSISDETRIAPNSLKALEEDKWDDLPGRAYTRGFILSYARALGLDEEDILSRYSEISQCYDININIEPNEDSKFTDEKSFISKYWPAFLILIIVAIVYFFIKAS